MPTNFLRITSAMRLSPSKDRGTARSRRVTRLCAPFKDGKPEGSDENFLVGFWASGERRAGVWPPGCACAGQGRRAAGC
jgi:hypothetical protein